MLWNFFTYPENFDAKFFCFINLLHELQFFFLEDIFANDYEYLSNLK